MPSKSSRGLLLVLYSTDIRYLPSSAVPWTLHSYGARARIVQRQSICVTQLSQMRSAKEPSTMDNGQVAAKSAIQTSLLIAMAAWDVGVIVKKSLVRADTKETPPGQFPQHYPQSLLLVSPHMSWTSPCLSKSYISVGNQADWLKRSGAATYFSSLTGAGRAKDSIWDTAL